MIDKVLSILGSQWLIHQDTALSYLPLLVSFINGKEINLSRPDPVCRIATRMDGSNQMSVVSRYQFGSDEIPDNSIGIMNIDGPMLSENYTYYMSMLRVIENNDRINATILLVNTPGGQVTGLDLFASTIKSMQKPVVAVITGMAASAGMWIISATTTRIATSDLDVIGSIGTKTTFSDFSGLFEKLGIRMKDIYATKSTRKDEQYRAMKDNNDEKPTLEIVDFVNDFFHQQISKNLGIAPDSEVFTGAVYFAAQAKQLGLINDIMTIDQAIEKAYTLGLKYKISVSSKFFRP